MSLLLNEILAQDIFAFNDYGIFIYANQNNQGNTKQKGATFLTKVTPDVSYYSAIYVFTISAI